MVMHVLTLVSLVRQLHSAMPEACETWFADDATTVGCLSFMLQWWQHLTSDGPDFGHFPNASKTVLIVKPEC